jgi:hypothetical protein
MIKPWPALLVNLVYPSSAYPLQQPGHRRQLGNDAGDDEGPGGGGHLTHIQPTVTAAARWPVQPKRPVVEYVNTPKRAWMLAGLVRHVSTTGDGPLVICSTSDRPQVGQYVELMKDAVSCRLSTRIEPYSYQSMAIGLEWFLPSRIRGESLDH